MLECCFQLLFGVIRHVEFTFQQICGGTVCNLRFFSFDMTEFCYKGSNISAMKALGERTHFDITEFDIGVCCT